MKNICMRSLAPKANKIFQMMNQYLKEIWSLSLSSTLSIHKIIMV